MFTGKISPSLYRVECQALHSYQVMDAQVSFDERVRMRRANHEHRKEFAQAIQALGVRLGEFRTKGGAEQQMADLAKKLPKKFKMEIVTFSYLF